MNPYLDRLEKKSRIGVSGRASEKRVIKGMKAKAMPASGNMDGAKSDATLGDFRLEMKSTTSDVMKLEMGWLNKISSEAISHNQTPALIISFVDVNGKSRVRNGDWVCVPRHFFESIV